MRDGVKRRHFFLGSNQHLESMEDNDSSILADLSPELRIILLAYASEAQVANFIDTELPALLRTPDDNASDDSNELTLDFYRWLSSIAGGGPPPVVQLQSSSGSQNGDPERMLKFRWFQWMIPQNAMENRADLQSVRIPVTGITSVGDEAFFGCKALKTVTFFDTLNGNHCETASKSEPQLLLRHIGKAAFRNCSSLETISVFPSSLRVIEDYAFCLCSKLKNVQFGSELESLGRTAFFGCTSLTVLDLSLAWRLDCIPLGCFANCTSLTMVQLPPNLTRIHTKVFSKCRSLVLMSLPASVQMVGVAAFQECQSLQNLEVDALSQFVNLGVPHGHSDRAGPLTGCEGLCQITWSQPLPTEIPKSVWPRLLERLYFGASNAAVQEWGMPSRNQTTCAFSFLKDHIPLLLE
mmetsp:Transcript_10562/g.21726  ORF Transcript_10562/g.21726 Transcript_10562/m.21726 type:complete len:409 (-) Transcript_10562:59-1285(-)